MTMPSWPTSRGFVLADGFKDTLPVLAERGSVDSGPVKQRMNSISRPDSVTVRYLMKTADRDWLLAPGTGFYFDSTLGAGGANWFSWTHPATLTVVQARFVADKPPAYEPYKPDWLVSVDLEWRPA